MLRKVVNFEQTAALWLLIMIMAVPGESGFAVSRMASLSPWQIEKRGYCSGASALICQSTSEVAQECVRSERSRASALKPRVAELYLSEASSDEGAEEVQEHEHFRTCRRVLKASVG